MRKALIAVLALLLASCSEPEPPDNKTFREVAQSEDEIECTAERNGSEITATCDPVVVEVDDQPTHKIQRAVARPVYMVDAQEAGNGQFIIIMGMNSEEPNFSESDRPDVHFGGLLASDALERYVPLSNHRVVQEDGSYHEFIRFRITETEAIRVETENAMTISFMDERENITSQFGAHAVGKQLSAMIPKLRAKVKRAQSY